MMEDDRLRIKRKDFHSLNDEFSDFSVSSPARKIRRLDVDLAPIREDVEIDMAMEEEEEEEECAPPVNEERAIVLFKPPPQSHSGQLFADRDLIAAFKNRLVRDAFRANDNHDEDEKCQALVCWNPSQSPSYSQSFQQPPALEICEVDETAMDIEEDNKSTCQQGLQQQEEESTYGFGLHQWQQQQQQQQQQHCMIPQLPQVSTTPITWFR